MSYTVREGQINRLRRHGTLASSVTDTVPEGQFLAPGASKDEYMAVAASPSVPVVFLNLVGTDRNDVTDGGIAVLGGESYELETTVYDTGASFSKGDPVTVKKVGTSVSGLITAASSGEYIHGWVKQAPAAGNGNVLVVTMCASNDGKAS